MRIKSIISSIPIFLFGIIAIIETTKVTGCYEFMEPLIGIVISLLVVIYTIVVLIANKRMAHKSGVRFNFIPAGIFIILLLIWLGLKSLNQIRYNDNISFSLELHQIESNEEFHMSDYEDIIINFLENGYYEFTYYYEWDYCKERGKYFIENDSLILDRKGDKIIEYCDYECYRLDTINMIAYPLDTIGKSNELQKFSFNGRLYLKR